LKSGVGTFGYESGLTTNSTNRNSKLIKCNTNNGKSVLQQREYLGDDGVLGQHTYKTSSIDYNQLESIIPGFKFINQPCNPCENTINSYSCPFELNIRGTSSSTSPIWKYLWNT
jgi:hypothetical protein